MSIAEERIDINMAIRVPYIKPIRSFLVEDDNEVRYNDAFIWPL